MNNNMNKIDRGEKVYNILCNTYGEESINFFANIFGMNFFDTEEMENALIDEGLATQYDFADTDNDLYNDDEFDNNNDYEDELF